MIAKAILVDDEQPNLDNLRTLLNTYCPRVEVCGTALNAENAKTLIYTHKPDLLFLDIQMPGQNGFDLLRNLYRDFEVIFVTAYDQYAIQALRFAAIDYLLKPVDIHELQAGSRSRDTATPRQRAEPTAGKPAPPVAKSAKQRRATHSAGYNQKETRFVKTGEIIRCESSNNYSTFFPGRCHSTTSMQTHL